MRGLATLDGGLELSSVHTAGDGTRKLIFRLTQGPGEGGQVRSEGALGDCLLCASLLSLHGV